MELEPATLTQLQTAKDGNLILVEDDVQNVVNDLHEIDRHLRVRFSEAGNYFVVYWKPDDEELGNGDLVMTAQELDQRIVHRIQHIGSKEYNFVEELRKADEAQKRDEDHAWSEWAGETGEKLAWAARKDLGYTGHKAFIKGER